MEVELPNIHKATSSDHWSLASSQYPSGKFPKVSVGITIPRAGTVSRGGDATPTPTLDRNLSQGTDGLSRPKGDNTSPRVSQEAVNHVVSTEGAPEADPVMKVSVSQPDDNACEQTGTFSFGTRREQGSNSLDKLGTPEFVSSQRKQNLESADKGKPNSEMLRMKLWEILGGTSQNKQAVASPNPDDIETPDQPRSQTVKGPSSGNEEVFTSPFPDNIKTPDPLKRQTVNFTKCKLSLDPIESDSDSPKVVERRPVTRSLGRKKAPASYKKQSRSAKKPLSTFRSTPKKKILDNVFTFNEKCTPKTVDQGEMNKATESPGSGSPDSAKKRENRKQPYLSPLSPTEDEGIKSSETSFARGYKSHKRPSDIDGPDKSPVEHMGRKSNLKEDRMSKRHLSSPAPFSTSATQETTDSDKEQEQCPENFLTRDFDQASKQPSRSAKKPFSTFHSTPKKKMQGNVFTFNEKRTPKTVDQDKMDKTTELPGSESPGSAEERENSKQPSHSPLSPTEDEGSKSSEQSFAKDIKGPDKSPLEHVGRKSKLKEDRMSKRYLSSPTPSGTSGTQETIVSDKEQEQCPENYLTRAFDQLVVVLGRFQTKIKSETSKKSSEILAATREIIYQHLEGVEAQMQADVDILINTGKSKRKRLESTFEDQQEKLRILHEKFKEEVNKQLLNCRSSLEDFESYHAELKGVADKQKSSHKKLLVNAEKTVGAQINDAETKIAEVQKRARKRMNGLKYVLKELITETAD
ncbi:meiosis-specific protein PAIR3-like isoform X2 [Miscanthus floridulus]|uniref:meiosis-specific protein PAIR3-like isoform X2 n=1 Tax=Miscanthus floridulus TaxID=154761 RepID=UPI003459C41A